MGLLDDASSVISGRTAHSTSKRHHRSHHRSSRKHHRSRSKDRSSPREYHREERSRSRRRSSKKHHHRHAGEESGSVMGGITSFFASPSSDDDDLIYGDHEPAPSRSQRNRSRSRSRHRGSVDDDSRSFFSQSNASRALFNLAGGNASRSSFFAGFGGRPSTPSSYYKRSPRPNLVTKLHKKIRRLLRDLLNHAKRHPLKVFMLVIMPLLTGGFLTALLAKVGIRLPKAIERLIGVAGKAASGDSVGLVGEAVKLAGAAGGAAGAVKMARSTVERSTRGYDGSSWEKTTESFTRELGGGGGWGDGMVKGVTKFFSD
ncbi:hypothetical protein QC762_108475 [Podospora pseudocomata]|uniref:Uncharacterized protein n=1 Tax=Podospora pseudocomata TaxID=2093779 RepID=A0ABR0GUH6_9PEZI|nr:hypothetical protein QC762_108475 [Podospora pseudocomata]